MIKLLNVSNLLFFFIITLTTSCSSAKKEDVKENEMHITCDSNEFDNIYQNFKENTYITATISYNGKTWEGVKLRVRGDSSRKLAKKSLKLKFSKKDLFFNKAEKINLNAEWYDKSYMTQYLSSSLMRTNNIPCFESKHVFILSLIHI